jgi:hypothetical protein
MFSMLVYGFYQKTSPGDAITRNAVPVQYVPKSNNVLLNLLR